MTDKTPSSMSEGWPEARQFRRSIRFEISAYVSGVLLLLMLTTGYVITDKYVDTVTQQVVDKLLVQARSFSGTAGKHIISTSTPDALMLTNTCKKLAADNPDVFWAAIAGTDNTYLAHTDIREVMAAGRMPEIKGGEYGEMLRDGEGFALTTDTIYINIPIRENGVPLGRLGVASSARQIADARWASIVAVASITVLMLAIGLPVTMLLLNRRLRPIRTITDALKRVSFESLSFDIPIVSKNEFGYLAETLRVMGSKLSLARKELIETERMARELEIAREIQASILPKDYPSSDRFEFAGTYTSALEVGGDYYDFLNLDEKHLAFLVADVSGKSLPGMLVMLLTRDMVKKHARILTDPAAILSAVNRELRENIKPGMFVTMFFGVLDTSTGVFSFASAGHNPLLKISGRTGQAELIKTKGFPLGMMKPDAFDQRIESTQLSLNEGDWLVQYTDGINEAHSPEGEEYGMDRFLSAAGEYRQHRPSELVAHVLENHRVFVGGAPQFDDITLLTMKWTGICVDSNIMTTTEAGHRA
jgi:sigma-B regulation protein RsbU (phosphoserine phosphatase)